MKQYTALMGISHFIPIQQIRVNAQIAPKEPKDDPGQTGNSPWPKSAEQFVASPNPQ